MIKEIKITNFYSFSQETVVLHPEVNVLIGINGSGKSNFFKAVRLLQEGISGKGLGAYIFENLGGFDNILFKGNKNSENNVVELTYVIDRNSLNTDDYITEFTEDIIYSVKFTASKSLQNYFLEESVSSTEGKKYLDFQRGEGSITEVGEGVRLKYPQSGFDSKELALRSVSNDHRFAYLLHLKRALSTISVYDYFDTTANSGIRTMAPAAPARKLSVNGSNLAQIINSIKNKDKQYYKKIVAMLKEVNPNFSDFDFNIAGSGSIELMLEETGLDSSIHVSSISDGTLKYLCLLAILYNPERGKFICIDEPELGLHPDMIYNISKAIKEASEQSTIIVATHSVGLLNYFRIENLQVFEKDDNNATRVVTYKEEQFEGWYESFNVGQMWIAGDFGGVRYGG